MMDVHQHFDRVWNDNHAEVLSQARADLITLCKMPGKVRNGYLTHCAELGVTSIADYVALLEAINAAEFALQVSAIFNSQFPPEAA